MEILLGKAHARTGTHRLADSRWVVPPWWPQPRVGTYSTGSWTNGRRTQLPSLPVQRERQWGSRLRFVTSSILNGGDAQPCGRYIGGRVLLEQCARSATCAHCISGRENIRRDARGVRWRLIATRDRCDSVFPCVLRHFFNYLCPPFYILLC